MCNKIGLQCHDLRFEEKPNCRRSEKKRQGLQQLLRNKLKHDLKPNKYDEVLGPAYKKNVF